MLDRGLIRNMPEKTLQEAFILNTWGTNAIEGNTLTLEEVATIIEKGLTVLNGPVRDLLETTQHMSARTEIVRVKIASVNIDVHGCSGSHSNATYREGEHKGISSELYLSVCMDSNHSFGSCCNTSVIQEVEGRVNVRSMFIVQPSNSSRLNISAAE